MADRMVLALLAGVLDWDDATATAEYDWVRMMSHIKFDGYADFRAGSRFVESLVGWLKQFAKEDRSTAYDFLKHRLVYISPAELRCLIELFFPEVVTPALRRATAKALGIKPYEVWSNQAAANLYTSKRRRTLFMGMSDGSRIDLLRRANVGRMSQEQVVATLSIDGQKWAEMGADLIKDEEDETAKFERVFLVEDFAGSGTTFIRQKDGAWKGKLKKFEAAIDSVKKALGDKFPIAENYALHVHHYICTDQAWLALEERLKAAASSWEGHKFGTVSQTYGIRLPASLKMARPADTAILDLCDKYYDPALDKRLEKHLAESGIDTAKLGYAACCLPLVLDHNTPNNSVPLIWAETPEVQGKRFMEPLFLRRDRHG